MTGPWTSAATWRPEATFMIFQLVPQFAAGAMALLGPLFASNIYLVERFSSVSSALAVVFL